MKKLIALLLFAIPLMGQQPQTSTAPIYAVNSKYTNGVAPGYWPQAGAGLVLNLSKGTVNCANTMTAYAGGTLTLANNTTNYVYLDTAASCAPASNTTGFTSTTIPIATVVTLSGVITTITDDRTPFSTPIGAPSIGSGTNPKLAIWATGTTLGNIGTPTLCSTGQAPTGIDANGNATGCASISGGAPGGSAGGDLTGTYPNPTIAPTGATAASCGDATHSCSLTINTKGQITGNSNSTISGGGGGGIGGGTLGGLGVLPRRWATMFAVQSGGGAFGFGDVFVQTNCGSWFSSFSGPGVQSLPTPFFICNTGSTGTYAGFMGNNNNVWPTGSNIMFVSKSSNYQVSSIRFRAGFGDPNTLANWLSSDTPTTAKFATFRFSTSASDTHFKCETGDGSAITVNDSGITPASNTNYVFKVQFNDSVPNVVFSINGSVVCTNTTHLPPTNTALGFVSAIVPLTSITSVHQPVYIYMESDN